MAEYVGGESMAVAIGDPITFVNKVDDAISRKSAINTVMSLYGKCDTLSMDDYRDMLIEALEVLPPTIAIVRCKDCKFYTKMRTDLKTGICSLACRHLGDDGFCSEAERRTDE